jgi:hypothetical protein
VILDKFPAVAFQEGSYWGRKEELKLGTEAHACNPSTGRQRQEDHEFKTTLDYIARPCLKEKEGVLKW